MVIMKLKHHYKGKRSQKFWDIVNTLRTNEADRELYGMACQLQALEEKVLKELKDRKKALKCSPPS